MALTKVTGEFIDIGDIDISDVGTISLDAIQGDADANTSITFSGSDVITIATGGSGRLTIGDGALSPVTNNQIDLGTSSLEFKNAFFDGTVTADAFAGPLTGDVTGNVSGTALTVTQAAQTAITSVGTLTSFRSTGIDDNADALAMTIDSSENVVIGGGTAPRTMGFGDTRTQIEGVSATTASLSIARNTANVNGPYIILGKSRGSSIGSNTAVQDGDHLGRISFNAADGTDMGNVGAEILALVDGTPGDNDTPGKLEFRTTPDGSKAATTRMTVTSAGNVGIGSDSPDCTLEVNGSANSEQVIITGGGDSSRGLSISTAANAGQNNAHVIFNAQDTGHADYPMITFQTGGTERMRIQPAGHVNIGIGGSGGDLIMQPLAKLYLDAGGNTYIQESAGDVIDIYTGGTQRLRLNSSGATLAGNLSMTSSVIYASQIYVADRVGHRDDASTFIDFDTDIIKFATSGEIMRIAANGCVGISETTPQYTLEVGNASDKGWGTNLENNVCKTYSKANANDTQTHRLFSNNSGGVGSITTLNSATAYNTSSDYRLKENVTYSWDATTRLKQLKPCRFNWIVDDTNTLEDGFLAHEVSSVVTNAIVGDKDAVDADGNPEYQQIDQGKLIPLLVKTIQELEARIATLEE